MLFDTGFQVEELLAIEYLLEIYRVVVVVVVVVVHIVALIVVVHVIFAVDLLVVG